MSQHVNKHLLNELSWNELYWESELECKRSQLLLMSSLHHHHYHHHRHHHHHHRHCRDSFTTGSETNWWGWDAPTALQQTFTNCQIWNNFTCKLLELVLYRIHISSKQRDAAIRRIRAMALVLPLLLDLDADVLFAAVYPNSSTVFSRLPRRKEISLETSVDYMIIECSFEIKHEDWIYLAHYSH